MLLVKWFHNRVFYNNHLYLDAETMMFPHFVFSI